MSNWREVSVTWQDGKPFTGMDGAGRQLVLGTPEGFSPMELLLISLAGCTSLDVVSILQKSRQPLKQLKVITRGLRREEHPRSYTEINIEFLIWGENVEPRAVEQAISLSQDKYCSVSAMLSQASVLRTSYRINPEDDVTFK